MILILFVLIFLISVSMLWLCFINTREKFIEYKPVKENNKVAYKAMKSFEIVIIKIKNFFGRIFKIVGR